MLAAIAISLLSQLQPCGPDGPIFCGGSRRAFFEFAPSSGTGMGAACACTTPTGAKGETMTFTRASSGTCLKGATTSGIANGDMVTCSTDQPRVMPGGNGTGGNGLLVERAVTNFALRSEEFENVYYVNYIGTGGTNPTVTADQTNGPDTGTQVGKADRLQSAATSGLQDSQLQSGALSAGGAAVCSVFIRGNGTSGTTDLIKYNGGVGTSDAAACSFVSTSWTRCVTPSTTSSSGSFFCYLGNGSGWIGGTARAAVDVFVIGLQGEAGAYASSYIATTSAAVARTVETDSIPITLPTAATGSMALTVVANSPLSSGIHGLLAESIAGPTYKQLLTYNESAGLEIRLYLNGAVATKASTIVANAPSRFSGYWDGTNQSACASVGCTTVATGTTTSPTIVEIGMYNAVNQADGVIKNVCLDPNPSRCR